MAPDVLFERYRSLTVKERVGIVLAISVVIYGLWDFAFLQPMLEREKSLQQILEQKNTEISSLTEQIQSLGNSKEQRRINENRRRFDSIIQQLEIADQRLLKITSSLISPQQMPKVLEDVLLKSKGLKIRRLQGLGAMPYPERPEKVEEDKKPDKEVVIEAPKAWRHGLRIEFSGSYLDTLEYLKSLEQLDWKFYWESIELEVDKYPNINTAIKVYTLSLDEGWIDV